MSRLNHGWVAKGFTQMPNVDYHETTSSTPASTPVKTITAAANELGLPVSTWICFRRSCRRPLRKFICASLPVAVNSLGKSLGFSNASMV